MSNRKTYKKTYLNALEDTIEDELYDISFDYESGETGMELVHDEGSVVNVVDHLVDLFFDTTDHFVREFLYERYGVDKDSEEFLEWLEKKLDSEAKEWIR